MPNGERGFHAARSGELADNCDLEGVVGDVADNLRDAVMVKPNGDPARPQVHGNTVPDDHRLGMIDLEAVPAR